MLELIEIFHGTFNVIVVIINFVIGIKIASRYHKYKEKNLIFIGFAWIGFGSIYLPSSIKFLFIISMNIYLSNVTIMILNHVILPPSTICWLIAITDLLNVKENNRKIILGAVSLISIIFETLFFIFIFTGNLEAVGTYTGVFTIKRAIFSILFLFFFALVILVSGIIFASKLLKTDNPESKLKGKLLLFAFISFITGALFEVIFPLTYISIIITRVILVSSSIEFYMGYTMPEWAKKIFLKNKISKNSN